MLEIVTRISLSMSILIFTVFRFVQNFLQTFASCSAQFWNRCFSLVGQRLYHNIYACSEKEAKNQQNITNEISLTCQVFVPQSNEVLPLQRPQTEFFCFHRLFEDIRYFCVGITVSVEFLKVCFEIAETYAVIQHFVVSL